MNKITSSNSGSTVATFIAPTDQGIHHHQLRSKALLNSLDEAVILIGFRQEITFINRKAQLIFGLHQLAHKQLTATDVLDHIRSFARLDGNKQFEQLAIHALQNSSFVADNFILELEHPTPLYLKCYSGPIHDDQAGYLGRIWKFTDQTSLVRLDNAKSEFIAIASHQLRTPMTAICGYLDMLQSGDYGEIPSELSEPINALTTSSERMRELINDLLNVSRLETGKTIVHRSDFDLTSIITTEIANQASIATKKQVNIIFMEPAFSTHINSDPNLVQEAFKNYLTNAIKYTYAGTVVKVDLAETETSIRLSVSDQGIGIPQSAHKHLFEKMYRADNAVSSQIEGSGLGLYYVKQVIELIGGKVGFISEQNQGSTFWLELPKNQTSLNY